jgi:ABC-type Mn2+/Zn2+ transport system ATPase subunit
MSTKNIVLNVNGIEVIYNHVILVLKGVSLQVPEGGIVAILGGNGAGKTTTLRAVSNLLQAASAARSPRAASSCAASASKTSRPPTWCSAAWCR